MTKNLTKNIKEDWTAKLLRTLRKFDEKWPYKYKSVSVLGQSPNLPPLYPQLSLLEFYVLLFIGDCSPPFSDFDCHFCSNYPPPWDSFYFSFMGNYLLSPFILLRFLWLFFIAFYGLNQKTYTHFLNYVDRIDCANFHFKFVFTEDGFRRGRNV